MKDVSKLTVVMPAYNEGKDICRNLITAGEIISKFCPDYQIIAVNDGSHDNTREEMLKARSLSDRIHVISYEKNRGKGYAIKRGILASKSEYTAFLDSDLELSPELLSDYLETMERESADIVIGSKLHEESKIEYPLVRKVLSYGYYIFLKILFNLNVKDTQTGIKLFKTDVIIPIIENLSTTGFSFDIEILATASMQGKKIVSRPVVLNFTDKDSDRKSKISIKQVFRMFYDTLKVKKKIMSLKRQKNRGIN